MTDEALRKLLFVIRMMALLPDPLARDAKNDRRLVLALREIAALADRAMNLKPGERLP